MEITSFVLGMLTIVAVLILVAIVVGLVKINQLAKRSDLLTQLSASVEGDLRRAIENIYNDMSRETEERHKQAARNGSCTNCQRLPR